MDINNWSFYKKLKESFQQNWEKEGFTSPTPVQWKTADIINEGHDLIAESPTGSGKTLAYLLPLLNKINADDNNLQVIILASSHELVMQINQEIQTWGAGSGITSTTLIGGANIKRQLEKLKKRPQLVVGTPGRVQELIAKKKLKVHEVNTLVFDEGDQLLVPEHLPSLEKIIKSTMKERQILLFSATLPSETEERAKTFMNQPEVIRIQADEIEMPEVNHIYFVCEAREKIDFLRRIVRMLNEKALAFIGDKQKLSEYEQKLTFKGIDMGIIHSDTNKQVRKNSIMAFRNNKLPLLLATDVAARGLDIKGLSYIINVDLATDVKQYLHRAGRTGRFGSVSGTVISLVTPSEENILLRYAKDINVTMEKKELYKGNMEDAKK